MPAQWPARSSLVLSSRSLQAAWPALAALNAVSDLFQAGKYEQAREELAGGGQGARPGEEALWRSRLEATPDEALDLLLPRAGETLPGALARAMHDLLGHRGLVVLEPEMLREEAFHLAAGVAMGAADCRRAEAGGGGSGGGEGGGGNGGGGGWGGGRGARQSLWEGPVARVLPGARWPL